MSYQGVAPIRFDSVSATTTSPQVDIGTRCIVDGNEYIYVYNHGVSMAVGKCCYLKTASSGYTVSATNTAGQTGQFAGGINHATLPSSSYGWIMVKGLCAVAPDTNAVSWAADVWLGPGVDDGYTTCLATISTGFRVGWAIDSGVTQAGATFAASLGKAWIKSRIW